MSCTRTPTRTIPTPRSSSRRCRAPTRSCPTRSSGPCTTATASPACPARARRDFFGGGGAGGSVTCSMPSSAAPAPRRRRGVGPVGPPGQDLEVEADLSFEQAVFGTTLPVTVRTRCCTTCNGDGAAAGTRPVTCAECAGAGQIRRVRQSMLGQMMTTSACPAAAGSARWSSPRARRAPATAAGRGPRLPGRRARRQSTAGPRCVWPAGVRSGPGCGRRPLRARGGSPARALLRVGHDLVTTVPVSIVQAALGTTITLPTLDGEEELRIPAGSQSGRVFTLRGRGVPTVRGRGGAICAPSWSCRCRRS